jgi:hypothetical protein
MQLSNLVQDVTSAGGGRQYSPAEHAQAGPRGQTLDQLADRVRAEHNLVQWHAEGMLDAAIGAGEALVEAKGALGHGEFGPWLRSCGVNDRAARIYMRLFRNRQTSAVLEADSIDAALEALTTRRR